MCNLIDLWPWHMYITSFHFRGNRGSFTHLEAHFTCQLRWQQFLPLICLWMSPCRKSMRSAHSCMRSKGNVIWLGTYIYVVYKKKSECCLIGWLTSWKVAYGSPPRLAPLLKGWLKLSRTLQTNDTIEELRGTFYTRQSCTIYYIFY